MIFTKFISDKTVIVYDHDEYELIHPCVPRQSFSEQSLKNNIPYKIHQVYV